MAAMASPPPASTGPGVNRAAELAFPNRTRRDVARVVSVGRERPTGKPIIRLRDQDGRLVAIRLRPQQFRTLAHGVLGLAEAMEEAEG